MFDPDNLRVDLLKIKRKIYISYPEGSKERQDFLVASKVSEIDYLQNLIAPDLAVTVFGEYKTRLKYECGMMGVSLGLGACVSVTFYSLHQLQPLNTLFGFYFVPFAIGVGLAVTHLTRLISHWKEFKPFKQEYKELQQKIDKLIDELKRLSK